MLHVENAKYIDGYKIDVMFDDGTRHVVDLENVVFSDGRKIVSELQKLNLFKDFSIQRHTLTWKNGLDFAPEFLKLRIVSARRADKGDKEKYMTRDELERYRNDPNGVFYKITHSKSDHRELNKISDEVAEALKLEHEKERRLILEARERGEI